MCGLERRTIWKLRVVGKDDKVQLARCMVLFFIRMSQFHPNSKLFLLCFDFCSHKSHLIFLLSVFVIYFLGAKAQ